ncbi:hypothetical protein UFOVP826_16 [uncultured Caudovirales phage]|uniref:Uncharacterized protein n=1 Tax=uncultured Caudovirales phage TaxID=2100421 RepID=A0A6J5NYW0_9CAUD|nr:hypothetical protein UFOVP826_16 [uncultured Caudovirales phage]
MQELSEKTCPNGHTGAYRLFKSGGSVLQARCSICRNQYNVKYRDDGRRKNERLVKRARASKYPYENMIKEAKKRAKKKSLPCSINQEWAKLRWTGYCELTGVEFVKSSYRQGTNPFSATIDRIEPQKGYTPDNCRFIANCVNAFKSTMTDRQMLSMAKIICLVLEDKGAK